MKLRQSTRTLFRAAVMSVCRRIGLRAKAALAVSPRSGDLPPVIDGIPVHIEFYSKRSDLEGGVRGI